MKSPPTPTAIRQQRLRQQQRGFGLIEATISLLVASIGLLSLAQLFGVAAALNTASRNSTFMARAAQESIELLKAKSFSQVAEGTTTTLYKDLYTVSTQVEDTGAGLKKITVTVAERTPSLKTGGSRKSVFVMYQNNLQAPEGPLYNHLADPRDCGGNTSSDDRNSSSSNSGTGSYSSPSPTPTPQ
jgi:type II secretory pathway pseudopilin PulG